MKKSLPLMILIVLTALSACSVLQPAPPPTASNTPLPLPTLGPTQDNRSLDISGKWVIEETQPLQASHYQIGLQGGAYYAPLWFQIGETGNQLEFTQRVMIYDSVAYDYEWLDNRRIRLAVNVGLVGTTWFVFDMKLADDKLFFLDNQDGSTLTALSRWSETHASISTKTPTPKTTESLVGEFQFGEIVALSPSQDWQPTGSSVLAHRSLPDCAVIASGGGDFPSGLPETTIGGFFWLTSDGAYLLKLGEQIAGEVHVEYGQKKTDCSQAVETLLKSVHTARDYANAGKCGKAPKQRLRVGDVATVVSSSYLRTEPRWADDTRIRLVGPSEKLTIQIVGGPICAIYDKGEYSYWQVELSSGETGWMAEGDLKAYYLKPAK